ESYGVLRWPSRKAQAEFRAEIRKCIGSPASLYYYWPDTVQRLRRYLTGWWQYFHHGASWSVFAKLDTFVCERVARSVARAQPRGKRRRPRRWYEYVGR
ncbi:MAG: group II intron maturase-specific domain-containing protein, partial [Armatimonadota bacterium]